MWKFFSANTNELFLQDSGNKHVAVVLIQVHDVKTEVLFYRLLTPVSKSGNDYAQALVDALEEDDLLDLAVKNMVALVTDGANNMVSTNTGLCGCMRDRLDRPDLYCHRCLNHAIGKFDSSEKIFLRKKNGKLKKIA